MGPKMQKCLLSWGHEPFRGVLSVQAECTFCVTAIDSRPKVFVNTDGSGVVRHAGARLLTDLADATGLTASYSSVLRPLRPRRTGHAPRLIVVDLDLMLADGGQTITTVDAGGREISGPVLDADVTLIACHAEREAAAPTQRRLRLPPLAVLPG